MKWAYAISLYTQTHCTARGLQPRTIAAYRSTLWQFHAWVLVHQADLSPAGVTARDVLEYLEYLRRQRHNGDSAVNRQLTILKNFYRALVAMEFLEPAANPLVHFPKIKARPRKLPVTLTPAETERLLARPSKATLLDVRDRALLSLLYGTGIRASEAASLQEGAVDLDDRTIRVTGKGGHERVIPLNERVVEILRAYRRLRGPRPPRSAFLRSRQDRALSRGAIYERVRCWAQKCGLTKRVSPHVLRHTFATHLVRAGVSIVTIRDLLGHRLITSTQIYLHVTAEDLRAAALRHPIGRLAESLEDLLPQVHLPLQPAPRRSSG